MRILITQRGSQVIKEIEEITGASHSLNKKIIRRNTKKRKLTIPHLHRYQTNSSLDSFNETNSHLKTITPFIKSTQSNEMDSQQVKTVKLTMSKITFPKPFIGKYEKEENEDQPIISRVTHFLPSISLSNESRLYSLNEIIPPTKIKTLKRNFINENRNRDKMSRIDETKFRSTYEELTPLEKLNEVISYPKINSKKENLIKYLSESNSLNPVSLRTIVESDNNQISKVNKMCQILFHQEDQQRLVKEIIQTKLKERTASEKIQFQNGIDIMKREVDDINSYLKKYRKRVHDREKYRDIYNEMVIHHWKKFNLNRLNKGRTKKNIKENSQETISNMNGSNNEMLFNEVI